MGIIPSSNDSVPWLLNNALVLPILYLIFLLMLTVFTPLFWIRRRKYPLSCREPTLLVIFNVVFLVTNCLITLNRAMPIFPCSLSIVADFGFVIIPGTFYLIRSLVLYLKFEMIQEIIQEKAYRITKFKHYFCDRCLVVVYICVSLILFIPSIPLALTQKNVCELDKKELVLNIYRFCLLIYVTGNLFFFIK